MNEWGTLVFILLFVTNSVSRFVANLWIERINSNLKKESVFSMWSQFASWDIYLVISSK